jgi:hypothetical protein
MQVPLYLGPIAVDGFVVLRSGFRWLCEDGHLCQPGDTIAYCNISLRRSSGATQASNPFSEETRDLQIALSTPVGGLLRHRQESSRGGFLDQLNVFVWKSDFSIGSIDVQPDCAEYPEGITLRLLMLAGRRATEVAEVRSGLLTGWHNRSRAWRAESDEPVATLLRLGICELDGVIKGEQSAFLEIFHEVAGPAQIVFVPDPPLVPNSRFLFEKITRSAAQYEEISKNLTNTLATGLHLAGPEDWIFVGAMLKSLQTSPITDRYTILTRRGLRETGPADAIILSLNAETTRLLRHKQLGYTCWLHGFRMLDAGWAVHHWFNTQFELVQRSLDEIQQDYRVLIDRIREQSPTTQILICNRMSSDGADDVQNYTAFDAPLGSTLTNVEAKDMNLMLYDLAKERDIAVVDVDAIAAELGARAHLHSGVHQSGTMQAKIRNEILDILRARGVPGFGPPS